MPVRQTDRGFDIYAEFTDTYSSQVVVQESSSAEEPRVWVHVQTDLPTVSNTGEASIHLNAEGVDMLIAALQEWKDAQET